MRIGTWNMDGKGSADHVAFLESLQCDVLLLTEVPHGLVLEGVGPVRSRRMGEGARKDWAAVWSSGELIARDSGHDWSAAAEAHGVLFVSTVLPWNLVKASGHWPGPEVTTCERVAASLRLIGPLLRAHDGPVVFGGDWNHALAGLEKAGSQEGRVAIAELLGELGLVAPTTGLAHRLPGLFSIDHVAVPAAWGAVGVERVVASRADGTRLSDHEAYVVAVAG